MTPRRVHPTERRIDGPLVSIGLPVFEGERHLEQTLASLDAQTFGDYELIICDNASADGTLEICRAAEQRDARISVHTSDRNRGAAANYNRAFELARGRYFKWASHDDLCRPRFLERCVAALAADPQAVLAYPRAVFIDDDGRYLRDDDDAMATTSRWPARRAAHAIANLNLANAVFGLARTEALRRTRLIGPFVASDYVLLLELALLGRIVEVDEVLYERRLHPGASREAQVDLDDVAAWFHPDATAPSSVRWNLLREYLRSASRLAPSPSQRLLCLGAVPAAHVATRGRVGVGRVRQQLVQAAVRR